MNVPPPPPMAPPTANPNRKSNNVLIITIVVCVLAIPCFGVVLFSAFFSSFGGQLFQTAACVQNMESARDALVEYADRRGKFPPAKTWQTEIAQFYTQAVSDEAGPFAPPKSGDPWGCKVDQSTVFVYNEAAAGKTLEQVLKDPDFVLIFEEPGEPKVNAFGKYQKLDDKDAPARFGGKAWFYVRPNGSVQGFAEGFRELEKNSEKNSDSESESKTSEGESPGT